MTTDDFAEAARAEAERRWSPRESDRLPMDWLDEGMGSGFVLGALWARTHIGQEPTDAEVEAAKAVLDSVEYADEPQSIRAALSAARAARRDEKGKP